MGIANNEPDDALKLAGLFFSFSAILIKSKLIDKNSQKCYQIVPTNNIIYISFVREPYWISLSYWETFDFRSQNSN